MSADSGLERVSEGTWAMVIAVVLLGAGIATGSPLLVTLAIVPLGFVAVTGLDSPPETAVTVQRAFAVSGDTESTISEDGSLTGDPGERITVRVAVHNAGDEPLVDLRVVDGVPQDVPVVSGTPCACLTVGPQETATFEYEVELRRGEHTFEDATLRSRGVGGGVVRTGTEQVAGDRLLRCFPYVQEVPIDDGTNDYAGEIPTDEGGSGVEFYSVRDYEPGDPVRSIDWRRYANSRDLATIEFRAERATQVVCLIDRRTSQLCAQSEEHLPALELSVTAAERTFDAIVDSGYPTGVIGFNDRLQVLVDPGTDAKTKRKAEDLFESLRNSEREPDEHTRTRWGSPVSLIPSLLPGEAQIILFSSFTDETPVNLLQQLRIHGYPVCVVSPDVATGREDTAGRLTAVQRRTRLADARDAGANVVDWEMNEPLGVILNQVVSEVSSR